MPTSCPDVKWDKCLLRLVCCGLVAIVHLIGRIWNWLEFDTNIKGNLCERDRYERVSRWVHTIVMPFVCQRNAYMWWCDSSQTIHLTVCVYHTLSKVNFYSFLWKILWPHIKWANDAESLYFSHSFTFDSTCSCVCEIVSHGDILFSGICKWQWCKRCCCW